MSGGKYKNCCDKTGIWAHFQSQGWNYYDESFALQILYSSDAKFRNFYHKERQKISKPILFFSTNRLNSKMSYGNIDDDYYFIISTHPQIPVSESIHMAHELEHLVLCSEGYKLVSFKDQSLNSNSRKNKMLNDMIYDPILNNRLISFGYDLSAYLDESDRIQMRTIGTDAKDEESIFLVMTLYVKRVLDFRNIYSNILPEEIEFNKWVKYHYPEVIPKSMAILDVIYKFGLSNPTETEVSLKEILKLLNIEDQFELFIS